MTWLWLLLGTIAAHAMLPVGSPVAQASGSAFSATTLDVALAPKRKASSAETFVVEPSSRSGDARGPDRGPDGPYLPARAVPLSQPQPQAPLLVSRPAGPVPASGPAWHFRARAPPAD